MRHGESGKRRSHLYGVWVQMIQGCYNKKSSTYHYIGSKGIQVCDEWRNSYIEFKNWALKNGYKEGLGLFLIKDCSNYSPDNCKFMDRKERTSARLTKIYIQYNGEAHSLREWSKILKISYIALYLRLYKYGYSIEKAFTKPISKPGRPKK